MTDWTHKCCGRPAIDGYACADKAEYLAAQGMPREARRPKGSGPSGLASPVRAANAPKGHRP